MIYNKELLLRSKPIVDMLPTKLRYKGYSYGLSEAGYDIRIKQDIYLTPASKFSLASSIERFDLPKNLVGIVHDKSTWARQGLSVFNTVIEPGWEGYITLELVYHGNDYLSIPAGVGIAQVIFHELSCSASYEGKYQNQQDQPVLPIFD